MADGKNALSAKLKSMGVKLGVHDIPKPSPQPGFSIENIVQGRVHATPYGETFITSNHYPSDYRHGKVGLNASASLHMIYEWGRAAELAQGDLRRFIFLDTETTGLAGGTGTYAFLVGIGQLVDDGFELVQFFMRDPTEEPALLAALSDSLAPCQALVTFNGKSFDAPLLTTRYLMQGLASPIGGLPHLDLLPLARRLWRDRLPSRALGYLEVSILGAARSQEEVPGWLIPQLYFDYLRSGDARPLAGVFYHNAQDILALAALFSHTAQMLENPLELEIEEGLDLVAIARLFEELGYLDGAVQIYRKGLARGLPETSFWETIERLALLHRRRREWTAALELWRQAAEKGQFNACVELAKYWEHEARDCSQALHWTEAALELLAAPTFPPFHRRQLLPELQHRLERLQRKLEGHH